MATTAETDSNGQSIVLWDSIDLASMLALPDRIDDQAMTSLGAVAVAPLPALLPASDEIFGQCMRILRTLPMRADDEIRGKLRLELYRRHFGHLCRDALFFLTEHATLECKFFPTPVECQAIVARWTRNDPPSQAKALAAKLLRKENQARFDEVMDQLKSRSLNQTQIDEIPTRWKQVAAERCFLWRHADETFTLRPDPFQDISHEQGGGESPTAPKGDESERN